jgi:hypothetical protein
MCADDSDVVYLTVSARIAGTCAVNILLIDLSVAVLTVRRGRMHIFLSFFNSSLVERQHRLRGNIAYGRDVWQGPCYGSTFDLSFDNNGAGYIIISFGAAEKESRSGICDIDSIKGTPRFNLLRLVSTGFTSRVDKCRWLNSGSVLPLVERMFHLETS